MLEQFVYVHICVHTNIQIFPKPLLYNVKQPALFNDVLYENIVLRN